MDCYCHNNISYLTLYNNNSIKVYNFNKNKWKIYSTNKVNECIKQFIITNIDNDAKMLGSSYDNIYLWNFGTEALLNSIKEEVTELLILDYAYGIVIPFLLEEEE